MLPSNFHFLRTEWPEIFESASRVEALVHSDPRSACFYARRALELAVWWMYRHDPALRSPYQEHLSALLHEPTFRDTIGDALFAKTRVIKELGNLAVHSHKQVRGEDALVAARELFHVLFWLARTYARGEKPHPQLAFNPAALPAAAPDPAQSLQQIQRLEESLQSRDKAFKQQLTAREELDAELERLRAEIAQIKKENSTLPDTHDYSEAQTRDFYIDLLLKEAGWALDQKRDREFEVCGMPTAKGIGYADYVLWGDDGKPLAVVEAKRAKKDPRAGQQQAKLYADCLENQFGQRPIIFYSNGYDHWMWDDAHYPPRSVQGFYKKPELELLIQRRTTRRPLAEATIDASIVERYYQTRAIRRIGEAFEYDNDRKALVVMATGAGKTRTVIALCDLLMRGNWVKRILFLADRNALVKQAVNAFKKHLPDSSPVNLVSEKDGQGRVYVSTYQSMMGLIDESSEGQRRFGVGHFDLIVIDEAHRSVYQKFGAIFQYFDSLLVGLTATPKDEIDRNTYGLFDLERGVPTDVYSLEDAVREGYLVPPKPVSVPMKFPREGIKYDELSEEEKERWDALEWQTEEGRPNQVESGAINSWLFNIDTVDKVLAHLMTRGQKVAGGDRIGKTIIFAKNHQHAMFIAERFDANYPKYKGNLARVIDFQIEYAPSLIDDFSKPEKSPHIAISVDMLDTGIDVPEVVNLVFFKLVRSKTKFWQMIGRGTRLRPDLFEPGVDKKFFYVFDYLQNLEFFGQNLETSDGALVESLGTRIFKRRVELVTTLDETGESLPAADGVVREPADTLEPAGLRHETAERLRTEVASMNVDNFVVRPKRQLVEKYSEKDAWRKIDQTAATELSREVAGLPNQLQTEEEEAKRFDLLMLNLMLAVLRSEPAYDRLRRQTMSIAGMLEEKQSIPMVQKELELILDLQSEEWWQGVTATMLENVRKRLRELVKFIDKRKKPVLITDFDDEMGEEREVELPGFTSADNFERFRSKAKQFLRAHENHIAIQKLRTNLPLTATDLSELERMFLENGIGSSEDLERAKEENHGLGLFVRSLVGLDREAAKTALGRFASGGTLTARQIEFVNEIIDHLTEHGVMDAALLYESPFTDYSSRGVAGLFADGEVAELVRMLNDVRQRAAA